MNSIIPLGLNSYLLSFTRSSHTCPISFYSSTMILLGFLIELTFFYRKI